MSLVTTKEDAQILGVTPVRVRQLIKEQRLAAEKHGRDHLLQDREVERFKRHGRRSGRMIKAEMLKAEIGGRSGRFAVVRLPFL